MDHRVVWLADLFFTQGLIKYFNLKTSIFEIIFAFTHFPLVGKPSVPVLNLIVVSNLLGLQ